MKSTMMDSSLTLDRILRHGRTTFGGSVIASFQGTGTRNGTFEQAGQRAEKLAAALRRLGVGPDDRVGTLCWNHQEHLEAYFAVPCMGAVLHTINFRLFPEQIAYIANHAEDKVLIVDPTIAPLVAKVRSDLKTVQHVIVTGDGAETELGDDALAYEQLIGAEETGFAWPAID
ncbi:MAG: AMP-binding protein, partial [Actinomycetota bacterium]